MEMIADYINANRSTVPATFIVMSMVALLFPTLASTKNLSFNFPSAGGVWKTQYLHAAGKASLSENGIAIITGSHSSFSAGWATYYEPLHLWDPATGRVADFTSNFSFVIRADSEVYGDGMTFFLTPNTTDMPRNTYGGGFALVNRSLETYDGSYPPFIAVEFDTFPNDWDPQYEHVGIDVNTIKSVANASWNWSSITSGGKVNASVMYDSSQLNLSVKITDAVNASAFSTVDYSVNLKDCLPEWVTIGFSASTGSFVETHTIESWNFISSLQVQVTSNENKQDSSAAAPPPQPEKKKNNYWQWIITGVGSFWLLCFVLGILWYCRRSQRNKDNPSEVDDTEGPTDQELAEFTGPKRVTFREAAAATDDFSNERLLGKGGFGRVYKGYLRKENCEVAIKKITPDSEQGIKEYATEVKTISQLRHRNLVQLVGWCHEKKELLLIYEFMPNGSLDTHLFKGRSLLMWEMRHKIAQGLASALLYLHEGWKQCVLHRDIKASNIMLDSDFNAKLGDFGLARLVDHTKGSQTTVLAGTMGYMAPECSYTGKASKESDIYSFGVVSLEIACGRKVIDPSDLHGRIRLVDSVWELYGIGRLLDAVDPKLGGDYDRRQMQCLMIVGLWCVHPDYNRRPTIREALSVLNFEALPPILPSTPPVPTYANPQAYGPFPSPISSCDITSSSNGGGYTTTSRSMLPSNASSSATTSSSESSALLINSV